jgi:demethylmenaquinone methyltransferase/2-methoxy-6-polyprenyl-1,4-benzoquinol methylase
MGQGPSIRSADPETVREMFSRIASRYDLTNAALSFGLHRVWNARLARAVLAASPRKILDLCAGTGAIAHELAGSSPHPLDLTCADFCPGMLRRAADRLARWQSRGHRCEVLCADAMDLPMADAGFDAVTMAYGIRNVAQPRRAIAEAARVLRSGGVFGVLELTRPRARIMAMLHQAYLRLVVPCMGFLVTRDRQAYQYLASSIQSFSDPQHLMEMMREEGFERVASQPLWGGVCTLIIGVRRARCEPLSPVKLRGFA